MENEQFFFSWDLYLHKPSRASIKARTAQRSSSMIKPSMISEAGKSFARNTRLNEPQCCHCGWRGAHAPQCPFK
ncbi:hypothetical protein EDD18DRAFT_334350 [Armillaria luteobubalina]|uniref:Uncharacterized protein n=1 Tax=Armillaria luteobubalina TaxID=153913 RepID=A0AA39QPF8_9AGAR|nr:hypothetical protein EDD18DRAFT_334350 [Armillaria luteobubalina]